MEYYLFDFDGTLVDSMPVVSNKALSVLSRRKIAIPEGLMRILTPLGDCGSAEYFIRNFGLHMTVREILAEFDDYALPYYRDTIPAKQGVKEALSSFASRGIRMAVLTASPHQMLDPCLKRNAIDRYFDEIWSCDDFGTTKANPEIYRMAAEKLGCAVQEMVFFDDNLNAIRTAKEAGCRTVAVYDPSSEGDEAMLRTVADRYVRRLDEIDSAG